MAETGFFEAFAKVKEEFTHENSLNALKCLKLKSGTPREPRNLIYLLICLERLPSRLTSFFNPFLFTLPSGILSVKDFNRMDRDIS